ncbi:hypothetical protein Ae717Ps2_6851c [Pseudonocardia sp. Ae717_Ps2]|nr:hypothetical protein Ae717Ps2_6851c [Pseudonocardia sp. Ae717_Ps2]
MVRKIHGQLIEDFRADEASRRIAAALGYDRIRVYPRGSEWVRIELLIGDPLDGEVPAPLAGRGLSVSDVEITIARDELGNPLRQSWVEGRTSAFRARPARARACGAIRRWRSSPASTMS